ncbi:MAG: pyridoxal phosphate-dependent aminotransferase [Candidatus Obscuribacterales bacterium]|nr:pyridoxal phosphate-dependent aminotransferase [Candidatus Obscuribacterales bacterium]
MPEHAKHMDGIIEAMSIKYNNRVYEMKQEGHDVITLSFGEAYFDVPLFSFDDLPFPGVYHYSHSRGIGGLREKLAKYYGDRYGVPINPSSEIMLTSGSKAAIFMSLLAIVDPGDEVIVHEPTWVSYTEHLKMCRGVAVSAPHTDSIFDLGKHVTSKTKAIVICNPNNPTGYTISEKEMLYLHELCQKHDLYLIADEAYSDYFLNPKDFVSAGFHDPEKKHTIVCNSMSKNFGISGWRIGYVITNEKLLNQILKVNQHLITCPATILEYYLDKHFDEIIRLTESQIKDVVYKRMKIVKHLDELGLQYMKGDATFYIFISIENSSLNSGAFSDRLLEEYKVSTVPGYGFGATCDKHIRISVGAEPVERIIDGLAKVKQLIDVTANVLAPAR